MKWQPKPETVTVEETKKFLDDQLVFYRNLIRFCEEKGTENFEKFEETARYLDVVMSLLNKLEEGKL